MKTVREVLDLSLSYVNEGRPRHEVEWLIASALGTTRLQIYLQFDRPVEEKELAVIREGISRLKRGEPLAYVQGRAPFFTDEFIVSSDVLIPRPETETLVATAARILSSFKEPGVLFDICTGSGCVGLSLKKLFPEWHVFLSDISEEALFLAKKNASQLSLTVECLLGDLFKPFSAQKAHCIVANPPYLSLQEWETADVSLKKYEPKIALVGGKSGLEWYERFFSQVEDFLHPEGYICVEIGATQASAVQSLARKNNFLQVETIKDMAHRDRVLKMRR